MLGTCNYPGRLQSYQNQFFPQHFLNFLPLPHGHGSFGFALASFFLVKERALASFAHQRRIASTPSSWTFFGGRSAPQSLQSSSVSVGMSKSSLGSVSSFPSPPLAKIGVA